MTTEPTFTITPEPTPTPPASGVRDLAIARKTALMSDADFGKAYLSGNLEQRRTMDALHKIITADGADDAALAELAKAAGIADPPPPLPEVPQRNPMIPAAPKPTDYQPSWGAFANTLPADRLAIVQTQSTAWATEMKFHPALGNAIIERISVIGPATAKMNEDERATWVREQDAIALRQAGSPEKLEAARKDALSALQEIGKGHAYSEVLANAAPIRDPWLVFTLANHWRNYSAGKKS